MGEFDERKTSSDITLYKILFAANLFAGTVIERWKASCSVKFSFQTAFLFAEFFSCISGSAVQHAWVPKSVLAQVGAVARFNCTAINDEPVYWTTIPYESPVTHDIYIGEEFLLNGYGVSGRFSVQVDSNLRRYDLVIKKVEKSDAGVYICTDERGIGEKLYAELVVWDNLSCQEYQTHGSYMGDNVFGLDQDALSFTCRMNYRGNTRPLFEWSVGGRKFRETRGTDSGTTFSSVILAATSKLDGTSVTCEAIIGASSSEYIRTGVLWTSDMLQVKYAVLSKEIVEQCPGVENTLHCNPPCSYKLDSISGTQRCAVSYAAGTDVKWFYFYKSSQHNSETGESNSVGIGLLVVVFGSLVIALAISLWCLMVKKGQWPVDDHNKSIRKLEKHEMVLTLHSGESSN